MAQFALLLILTLSLTFYTLVASTTPVVMYHGMGDTANGSINGIKLYLEEKFPGIYVHSIQVGDNIEEDFLNSYFLNLNKQVEEACEKISNDPNLQNGYNGIGFSQGGQIMRAIAQRCPKPAMKNLISIGGQHQGVYGLPRCFGDNSTICNLIRRMLNMGAYIDFVQESLVQAEYWHDPLQTPEYVEKSVFLADINNEKAQKNESYKTNLNQLDNFVMVLFEDETIVDPKESEWFGFYTPGQAKEIVSLQNSTLYTEDWLGLKKMDAAGKLKFLSVHGDHLQFNMTWFEKNIVEVYLNN